ncbi:PilZ domain-containing protein [Magnetococcales bacterium HHB-1]
MSEKETKNKRHWERIPLNSFASLQLHNGEILQGEIRNISIGGAFLETDEKIITKNAMQTQGILKFDFQGSSLELEGEVVRKEDGGIGLSLFRGKKDHLGFSIILQMIEGEESGKITLPFT